MNNGAKTYPPWHSNFFQTLSASGLKSIKYPLNNTITISSVKTHLTFHLHHIRVLYLSMMPKEVYLISFSFHINSSHPVNYFQCLIPVRIEPNLLVCLFVCHLKFFNDLVCETIKSSYFLYPKITSVSKASQAASAVQDWAAHVEQW